MIDTTKRIMSLVFSRFQLRKQDFNTAWFIKILQSLPEGTQIRGMGEDYCEDLYRVLISHETFTELQDGALIPRITCKVIFPDTVELIYPESYKQSHTCIYKVYQGFLDSSEVCTICGEQK